MLNENASKIGDPAPPSGGSPSSEQTTHTGHDDIDQLIELGARVAEQLAAVVGTCHVRDAVAEASARTGMGARDGRAALHAYAGWLSSFLHTGRDLTTRPASSLGEVAA